MKKMIFVNFIMAALIIFIYSVDNGRPASAITDAGNYFVSADGSDRNPGTEQKPWKTIQKAADSAAPGSTVFIKGGTYYERINIEVSGVSAEQPTVFRNFNQDTVILDGSKTPAAEQEDLIHISNQSFIQLIGLELVNNIGEEDGALLTGIGIWGKGDGIQIKDCKIHKIWYTGASDEAGAQAIAVYGRNEKEPISGLVIEGNEIWDIKCGSSEAVSLNGNVDGFQFIDNYVHDTNNIGLALIGDETLDGEPVCADEKDNRARDGFVGYNKMERNSCEKNPCYPKGDFSADGIYADGAKDVVIAYNLCTGNDIGIEVENEAKNKKCTGVLVRDNLIYRNNSSGIAVGGYDQNRGWAVDCQFIHNTLYQNDAKKLGRGEISIAKCHDILFSSNIIYTGAGNLAVMTENFGIKHIYRVTLDHNIYYGPGGSRGLRFKGTETGLVGLNMWKQKTKQDGSSKIADPKFTDPAKSDFHLQQYSPAVDFGDPAYQPADGEKDYAGQQRLKGSAVDCGAYEL